MTAADAAIVFDPRDDAVMQCPYPHYARLRVDDPVHFVPGEWVGRPGADVYAVARYDLVSHVLGDWRTFSSRFGTPGAAPPAHLLPQLQEIAARGFRRPATMLTADPPDHTRYRRLVSKAFTPRRVAELAPAIQATVDRLCDTVDGFEGTPFDFVEVVCVPIPTRTIAAALGVPDDRFADFKRWADASVASIGRRLDDDGWLASAEGVVELQRYFADELEDRRAAPRDDLLTALLDARLTPEDGVEGEPLSMEEMISIVQQLQVAGSETTASLIADAVLLLADQPAEWDRMATEPERPARVVEEALRLASPNQGLFRIVTEDTELGGVRVPKGATLWILFGSANRDDAMFPEPERFDPDRPHLQQHLAFGRGPHYCVGAPLARLEATIALRTLAQRYAQIEPIDPSAVRYAPSCILRGLERLDVRALPRA